MNLSLSFFVFLAALSNVPQTSHASEKKNPFLPDYTNRLLGEAFKGPDEIVWGDIHSPKDVKFMTFENAKKYCTHIGAELPTANDFEELRKHIRTAKGSEVSPSDWNDYLPHLTYSCQLWETFYRGDARRYNTQCSWEFWTAEGKHTQIYGSGTSPTLSDNRSVRCIRRPKGVYKTISYSEFTHYHPHHSQPILGTLDEATAEGAVLKIKTTYDALVIENQILQSKSTNVVALKCKTDTCKEQVSKIAKGTKVVAVAAEFNKLNHEFIAESVYPLKEVNLITTNSYEARDRKAVELTIRSQDPVVIFATSYEGIGFRLKGDSHRFIAAFVQGQYDSTVATARGLNVNNDRVFPGAYRGEDLLESFGVSYFDFKKGRSFGYEYGLSNELEAEF